MKRNRSYSTTADTTRKSSRFSKRRSWPNLQSYYVLQAAVRNPGIASLSVFAGEPDPVQWLQENLEVDFPQQRRDFEHLAVGECAARRLAAFGR